MASIYRDFFTPPCLRPYPRPVRKEPKNPGDSLFWQFPCLTESSANRVHFSSLSGGSAKNIHGYLGLPWASFIDKRPDEFQLRMMGVRLRGLQSAMQEVGLELRIHTVCQHVYWRYMIPWFEKLCVTDLWCSHASEPGIPSDTQSIPLPENICLRPWHLYAVNFEDPNRSAGIQIGKDPADKKYLASFIGAHMPHYISDDRLRIVATLKYKPRFFIRLTGNEWHFEKIVQFPHLVDSQESSAQGFDGDVEEYNRVLSDSVFALCPDGAGANSLRFWEALAVGTIPVLFGEGPALPQGGTLPAIDWEEIVLRIPKTELAGTAERLSIIPLAELRSRQNKALRVYQLVKQMRCF